MNITSDASILKTVSGLDLEGEDLSYDNKMKYIKQSGKHTDTLSMEIKTLLGKQVIVKTIQEDGEFISPIFLRPKGEDQFRLILNLKELNQHLETVHFKMDTIYSVLDLITPNCFMSSIDLKDAYYTVPIADEYEKYFKFMFESELYKFTFT